MNSGIEIDLADEDSMSKRKLVALDFDGTVVSNAYPGVGVPEPNAAAVIKRLSKEYNVVIFTSRIALWDMAGNLRPGKHVAHELRRIHNKLRQMGLGYVPIHQAPYKIGADAYLDDKAIQYKGDWLQAERDLHAFLD